MAAKPVRPTGTVASSNTLDTLKWLLAAAIAGGGIVANFIYSGESLLLRMLAGLVIASMAGLVALQTQRGKEFWQLMQNARIELRRVVWPTHQETVQTALLVVGFVFLTALILWGLDWVLARLAALAIS